MSYEDEAQLAQWESEDTTWNSAINCSLFVVAQEKEELEKSLQRLTSFDTKGFQVELRQSQISMLNNMMLKLEELLR